MPRSFPNILITGTPGVGKSSLCKEIIKQLNFEWIEISSVAKNRGCLSGYNDSLACPVIDEDKIIDELDPVVESGGKIVEYHSCDFFPERWFDAVFVLRTNNTLLYDRLKQRGYIELKIQKNVECEIFQTILEEAMDSYDTAIVKELHNNDENDMEKNIQLVVQWAITWMKNNGNFETSSFMVNNDGTKK